MRFFDASKKVAAGVAVSALIAAAPSATHAAGSPVPPPGPAAAAQKDGKFTLANSAIGAIWTLDNGHLRLTQLVDRNARQTYAQAERELFVLNVSGIQGSPGTLPASAFTLAAPPALTRLTAVSGAGRMADRLGGWQLAATFKHTASGIEVDWRAELRDGSHYIRQLLRVRGVRGTLTGIQGLDLAVGPARQVGSAAAGNPMCTDTLFMGLELPMSRSRMGGGSDRWSPADMAARGFTRPVSGLKPGPLEVVFQFESGNHRIDVNSVALLVNGQVVSEDAHAGFSGNANGANSYRLTVPAGTSAGQLRVTLGGPASDTNSNGRITVSNGSLAASGNVVCDLACSLPLEAGTAYEAAAVVGAYPQGQLRRAFLAYLERERAAPYHQFLHYNGWFNFDRNVNEKGMIETIEAYHRELITKRGVPVKAFVIDDGWDDWDSGFWAINTKKFPNGFRAVGETLDKVGSRFGIWISPLAGYDHAGQRVDHARKAGLTSAPNAWIDLSYPPYYKWYLDFCTKLIKDNKVCYFKFDKAGNGVNPHFLGLLRVCRELRAVDPNIFINITVGTWPSPFWLNHIDCTWREGNDMGYEGPGNDREQWITYRDAQTWRGVVSKAPLYPLNSIMNHGICLSDGHSFPKRALKGGTDLRHEVRSYFGSGTALQELYVKPAITPAETWDQIAEAAKWSRANADILVDTHWIGGNPSGGRDVYGWASWAPRKGLVTLRNPSDKPQTFNLDIAAAFELPAGAPTRYAVASAYADTPAPLKAIAAGTPETITLQPFEVLVLEMTPQR